jgi:hypothetical protein
LTLGSPPRSAAIPAGLVRGRSWGIRVVDLPASYAVRGLSRRGIMCASGVGQGAGGELTETR